MSDIADEVTEGYAAAMEEAIESATKAEAERDAALTRVAELEAQYEPPRPVGNTPIRIVPGRAYLVKVYKDGNLVWSPRVASDISGDGALTYSAPGLVANWTQLRTMFVKGTDMIEFEMFGRTGTDMIEWSVKRQVIESMARQALPEHIRAGFEDDEPGAPYPQRE